MSHHVRVLLLSATLGYRALFAWNTPALFVSSLVVTPALQIVFFVLMGQALGYGDPSFFILGNAVQVAAAAGVSGLVSVIADERRFGTLTLLLASPGSRTTVLLGRMLPGVAIGAVISLVSTAVGVVTAPWDVTPGALGVIVLAVLASAVSSAALGLVLSALGLVYRDVFQLAGAAYLLTLLVSGANVDRQDLPGCLQVLGGFLPQTNAIAAIRAVAAGSVSASLPWVVMELCVGVAWATVALVGMRVLEQTARRRSTVALW